MTTTKQYGSWHYNVANAGITLESAVTDALDSYDYAEPVLDAIIDAYRTAINEALPAGVQLCGNEFYGPAYTVPLSGGVRVFPDDNCFDGYPVDGYGRLDIDTIVAGVDFWSIVHRITGD